MNMKKTLQICFLGIFFLAISLPMTLGPFAPSSKLAGVVKRASRVPLTWETLLTGKFQQYVEHLLQKSLPVRAFLVQLDNQINFSFFHQIGANKKLGLILGNENHLIERSYVQTTNRAAGKKQEMLSKLAVQLATIQNKLDEHGVAFFLLMSPNKVEFYPHLVPDRYRVRGYERRMSLYERFLPLLEQHEVRYFDAHAFLRTATSESVFLPSGTHWSEYASCLAASEFIRQMKDALQKPMITFSCDISGMKNTPSSPDRDILRLANLPFPGALLQQAPSIIRQQETPEEVYRPNVLIEGTSFLWAFFRHVDSERIFGRRDFLYYFKSRYTSGQGKKAFDPQTLSLERDIFSRDAVIIEVNTAFIHQVGHGFINFLIERFEQENF